MASNDHVFGREFPDVPHPRKQINLLERRKSKQTTMKRKQPRTRSSHRPQRSGHPKDRSTFSRKPRLYSQPSYIGPTDVEPFSTFKGSHVADGDPEEEGSPTAMCRMLGCWQTEPHSHDLPKRLETGFGGNMPQAPKPHITDVGGIFNNECDNLSLVGRPSPRPPSPLVAGPACLSERIVEPLPARFYYGLGKQPTKSPSNLLLGSYGPLSSSSILQPALGGTRHLRDALPPFPTSYEKSYPRVVRPNTWQVNLPIHPKPSTKREHENAKGLRPGSSLKRQGAEVPATLPTALAGCEDNRQNAGREEEEATESNE